VPACVQHAVRLTVDVLPPLNGLQSLVHDGLSFLWMSAVINRLCGAVTRCVAMDVNHVINVKLIKLLLK